MHNLDGSQRKEDGRRMEGGGNGGKRGWVKLKDNLNINYLFYEKRQSKILHMPLARCNTLHKKGGGKGAKKQTTN